MSYEKSLDRERLQGDPTVSLAERRLRALLEASTSVVYRMSSDWSEMRELEGQGFLSDTEGPTGSWVTRYIPPDDQPRVAETIQAAIRTKSTFELEHRVRRKDGTVGWTLSRAVPLLDDDGEIVEWIGTASDVTERKRAERQLRLSEQRLQAFVNQLPVGAGMLDLDGNWILTNSLLEGTTAGTMPSVDPEQRGRWRAFAPDGTPVEPPNWPGARALRGETVCPGMDLLYTPPQGDDRWIRVSTAPFRAEDGEILGAVAVLDDVTERRRTRDELAPERALLDTVVETLPAGLIVVDARGKVVRDNPLARDMLGGPVAAESWEDYGSFVGWWPDSGERIRAEDWPLSRALLRGEATRGELVRYEKLGTHELGYLLINVAPIRDGGGRVTGAVAAMLEVTDRVRLEQHLRASKEQAEEASEAKSRFLATVSHELRTPLNAIVGYTTLLLEGIPEPVEPESARALVASLSHSARHLRLLIADVLSISRLDAGQESVQVEDLSVPELLDEIRAVIEPLASAAGLRFKLDVEESPERVRTDPRKLRQILLNLLGNAVKFTDEGEVTLRVVEGEGEIRFHVSDTGRGIDPEDRERLFDPFWQGRGVARGEDMGIGLGLAICRRYTELLDAELSVESTPGEGSTFTLRLPSPPR